MSHVLTDEQIVKVWQSMPGGAEGWLKEFGFLQFAHEILTQAELTIAMEAKDAKRFDVLRQRYIGADFDFQGRGQTALIFDWNFADATVSADLGWTVDQAPKS